MSELSPESCLWSSIRKRAAERAGAEPTLASFLYATVLNHDRLEDAVSFHLADKLGSSTLSAMQLREIILEAMRGDPTLIASVCADIRAVRERDPAVTCDLVPLLFLKGVHALTAYRVAHWLWNQRRLETGVS